MQRYNVGKIEDVSESVFGAAHAILILIASRAAKAQILHYTIVSPQSLFFNTYKVWKRTETQTRN